MNYSDRIKKIQNYITEQDLQSFLVLTKLNRQYLSGFTGSSGAVLIYSPLKIRGARGVMAELYVDDRYTIRARRESPLPVRRFSSLPLRGRVREGWRIGIEDKITVREFAKLKKDHPRVKFVVMRDVVENLRAAKSVTEIKYIKKAQNIIDRIFSAEKSRTIIGKTEVSVAQDLERLAIKFGAEGMAFESIVAYGANAAAPHHLSGKQRIKKNNFLLLDFGVLVNGYHSDFTRTLFIGKPNKKQEKVYNIVLEAQRRAIEKITPSSSPSRGGESKGSSPPREEGLGEVKASLIDKTVRDYITSQGFGRYFTHNTGHGVGLEIHELPNFSPASADILKEGMIVTVEPGIYIAPLRGVSRREKGFGVRIEDMVLVTDKAPVTLSKSPRDFKSMIIK